MLFAPVRALVSYLCFFLFLSLASTAATASIFDAPNLQPPINRISSQGGDFYQKKVQPILEARCVNCHACYDAPCQLKLTSPEGIERGLSPQKVYNGTRLLADDPTRLYIDATSQQGWRDKGFYSVLSQSPKASVEQTLNNSMLYQSLLLKQQQPAPTGPLLSKDSYDFALNRAQVCPKPESYADFAKSKPHWGMPYGLPALSATEMAVIHQWLASGANMPSTVQVSASEAQQVVQWEAWFNQTDLRSQLVARYIYEHIYLFSLSFEGSDRRFKLVRSKTPTGKAIVPIATRRPYDPPGVDRVYYRLWPERESQVAKTDIPLKLTSETQARWNTLFYELDYTVDALPDYALGTASNPFKVFNALPADSRYRFMLDHAQQTIMAYIKGPVCRGQVAVNVINEHFWVYFVDPDLDLDGAARFLTQQTPHLDMPAESSSNASPLDFWLTFASKQKAYLSAKTQFIDEQIAANGLSLDETLIWDGEGNNSNAALTIFRHFDNASVVKGLVGVSPKTSWIIDYPLLERIHYLLVAGFDVFGNVGHQLNTRLYMDFLRMEGELNYLLLFPKDERTRIRNYWYREAPSTTNDYMLGKHASVNSDTHLALNRNQHLQTQVDKALRAQVEPVLEYRYALDQLSLPAPQLNALTQLQKQKSPSFRFLPPVSMVQLTQDGEVTGYLTLIHHQAHSNISSLLDEKEYLLPEEDKVTLAAGLIGDYPNVLLKIEQKALTQWVNQLLTLSSEGDYFNLLSQYGVRRTAPEFWAFSDQLHQDNQSRFAGGILDYNRLENR